MATTAEGAQTPYEVYCYDCRVTFPVGTQRCVHCGGRIGRQRLPRMLPGTRPGGVASGPLEQEIDEEELPKRGGRLSPIAALWLLLALGGAMYRACAGPS